MYKLKPTNMYKIIFLSVFLLGAIVSRAQLSGLMSKYHGQECVTITQLDKNLYGLYKKKNIPAEAEELLKQLDEVNILNLNPALCDKQFRDEVSSRFRSAIGSNYKVIKSHKDASKQQTIYTRTKNDRISDMIVWNETDQRLDIIELRGSINTESIAMLSKALNIKSLHSLDALNEGNEAYDNYLRSFDYNRMADVSREIQKMAEELKDRFSREDFKGEFDNMQNSIQFGWESMDSLFSSFGSGFSMMGNVFERIGDNLNDAISSSHNNTIDISGNSIRITEENGKTKIKIDNTNSQTIYIVDGIRFEDGEVSLPEKIRDLNLVSDKNDRKRSYLIIFSDGELGEFVSFKNSILTFKYNGQTYKYNLEKNSDPILRINGKLTNTLEGTDLSRIRQIRPLSQAEKETGEFKTTEVVIYTRK